MDYLLLGFLTGLSLILAIGAQNVFVIEQGLKKQYIFLVCLICSITKIFWAPIARIKLNPVKKPNNKYSIKFY